LRLGAKSIFGLLLLVLVPRASAAGKIFVPYASAKAILDEYRDRVPVALRNARPAKWDAWTKQQDKAIRARLHQGDLDSIANFVLFGTSFTKQPRIRLAGLADALKTGIVRARVEDLVAGLRSSGDNERLLFFRDLLRSEGIDPGSEDAGAFIYKTLQRQIEERKTLAERAAKSKPASIFDRSSLFSDRGL